MRVFHDDRATPAPNLLFVVELAPFDEVDWQPQDLSNLFFARAGARTCRAGAVNATGGHTVNAAAVQPEDLPAALPLVVPPKPWPEQEGGFLNLYEDALDAEWEKAKCKGANFVRAMRGTDNEAGQIFDPPRDKAAGAFDDTHLGKTIHSW